MSDKRNSDRCCLENDKACVDLEGKKENVKIIDISIGGMRIVTDFPIQKENVLKGEFRVLPNIGPFFVRGKVIWTTKKDNAFESGVIFDKVSTIPMAG